MPKSASASASASSHHINSSTPSYSYCLLANSGGSSSWDSSFGVDDGNNIDTDPFFVTEVDPATAPTTTGDLRLLRNQALKRQFNAILQRQVPDAEKRKKATYLIDTSKGLDWARQRVDQIIEDVVQGKGKPPG